MIPFSSCSLPWQLLLTPGWFCLSQPQAELLWAARSGWAHSRWALLLLPIFMAAKSPQTQQPPLPFPFSPLLAPGRLKLGRRGEEPGMLRAGLRVCAGLFSAASLGACPGNYCALANNPA